MTVISSYVDKNSVYMGCDSQVSAGFDFKSKLNPSICTKIKVFKNIMVGCSGTVKSNQILLQYFKNITDKINKHMIEYDNFYECYLDQGINLAIQDHLKEYGIKSGSGPKTLEGFSILFVYKNEIYKITSDLCIFPVHNNYFSIGNGSDFALGSLFSLNNVKSKTPIDKILLSLKSAKEHVNGVDSPFIVMNNKGLFEVYEENGEYFKNVYSTKKKRTKEKS